MWDRLDGAELTEWRRFYAACPFGPVRGDLQAGVIARAVYAAAGARSIPSLDKFVLQTRARRNEGEPTKAELKAMAEALGVPYSDGKNVDR